MKIKNLTQVTNFCPSQWEGQTEDGDFIYIRYRHGFLYASIAVSEDAWAQSNTRIFEKRVSEDDLGVMTTDEMLDHTGFEITGRRIDREIDWDEENNWLEDFINRYKDNENN